MRRPVPAIAAVGIIALVIAAGVPLSAQTDDPLVEGKAAFGDWHADSPGTRPPDPAAGSARPRFCRVSQ